MLAYSLRLLPHGMFEIHEYVFTLKTRSTEKDAIVFVIGNTPELSVTNYVNFCVGFKLTISETRYKHLKLDS